MEFVDLHIGNSSCRIHKFGATITDWKIDDEQIIFVSPNAIFDGKKAIRGGVPVCFPSFGPWEYGAQHGFARTSNWEVEEAPMKTEKEATVTLRLTDTEETRKIWNYEFIFDLKVILQEKKLKIDLQVLNTGTEEFSFTTALHTYFKVANVEAAKVKGLNGLKFVDKTLSDTPTVTETRKEVMVSDWTDRVYLGPCPPVTVEGVASGKPVMLTSKNLPDVVLWNPWKDKAGAMADLGEEAWPNFLCVEAGQCVKPITVAPSADWTATHEIAFDRSFEQ